MRLSTCTPVIFGCLIMLLSSCDSAPVPAKPDVHLIQLDHQIFHIDSIKTANREELNLFIQAVLDTPLPDNYQIPDYLQNITSVDSAYAELHRRYPGIALRQGESLREAIAENPIAFVEMIYENRVLRNKISALESQ